MLPDIRDYPKLYAAFRWNIPLRYNIGVDICDRWAAIDPGRPAILDVSAGDQPQISTYGDLRERSNRLAKALVRAGIIPGDRIAIMLPQGGAVPVAHIATYKLGAIAVPLAALFGVDALAYRMQDSGARVLITNAAGLSKLRSIGEPLPDLALVISVDGDDGPARGLEELTGHESLHFTPRDTLADDPALMIYTSGTTGNPKGALHGHRVLLGHLPGVQLPHAFLPQPGDRLWTPADWAWAGGLLNILLPGLHFGVPVVARKFEKFDPELGLRLVAEHGIRNVFIPPTALRMLRSVKEPRKQFNLNLRTLASGGESLGAETLAWGREALGLTINEFYGQTECNLVLSSCDVMGVVSPGAIGKPVPGHDVAVIRPDGSRCAPEEEGQIAVQRPDPVMFLNYWNNPKATQDKFIGDWMTTGDQGLVDAQGYFRFVGRDDDVITSSGYRIGPGEIEDCLIRHEAVALAAVVGKPDPVRTEIVKAFIVLQPGFNPSAALEAEIRAFVRNRLSAHEYPREIAFIDALPLTTTGKVIRRLLRDQA
jgi:acetyl-CoA synthetase